MKGTLNSLEESYKVKTKCSEDILGKRNKTIAIIKEHSGKDIDEIKNIYLNEIRLLNQSWGEKYKVLGNKCSELETELAETDEKIRQEQIDIKRLKNQSDKEIQELDSKLNQEVNSQLGLIRGNLQNKLKALEGTNQTLNKKIEELMNDKKNLENNYKMTESKFEYDNSTLRKEMTNLQKNQSARFSEYERVQKNYSNANTEVEVNLCYIN